MVRKGKTLLLGHMPPKPPIFAELDISDSLETNFFPSKIPNLRDLILRKKSWSRMVQKCLIRRKMVKKKIWRQMVVFEGSGGTASLF